MRAITTFDYNGHRYHAGDEFEPASAGDGRILILAQLAAETDDKPAKKTRKRYSRADLRAEDE